MSFVLFLFIIYLRVRSLFIIVCPSFFSYVYRVLYSYVGMCFVLSLFSSFVLYCLVMSLVRYVCLHFARYVLI